MEHIEIEGIGRVKVRKGANIRHFSVKMAPGRGVWVNVPPGVSRRRVEQFLLEQKEWILRTRSGMKEYERKTGVGLDIGAEIKTKLHTLKIAVTPERKPAYQIEGEKITLFVPEGTVFEKIEGLVKSFLLEIYKMECKRILPERVRFYAQKYGFSFSGLSFRNNISNWGSCSTDDRISLNIKLMKLPDELIDYVILHELCHTVEKNHSAAFWKLVKEVCPDAEARRKQLRTFNTRL